jgi:hypothetical protein
LHLNRDPSGESRLKGALFSIGILLCALSPATSFAAQTNEAPSGLTQGAHYVNTQAAPSANTKGAPSEHLSPVSCSAPTKAAPSTPVNGACGSTNDTVVSALPTTNLCAAGTPSAVTGGSSGKVWTWSCAGSNGCSTASCSAIHSSHSAQYTLYWHGDSALAAFLKSSHPGVGFIAPGSIVNPLAASIKAKGYQVAEGLGGYAAQWMQGYPAASHAQNLKNAIDKIAGDGATMIYVDEPWDAPGESSPTTPASIAYNVRGFNLIYNYIHTKHPGVQFGLSIGYDGGVGLHLAMLKAGLKEDFSQVEPYNCCMGETVNPFVASGQTTLFPNVKLAVLAYNTSTICNGWINPSEVDYISFWDVDNYGGWIGPWIDASWLQNAETFAATGNKPFCALPDSFVNASAWTWNAKTATFTVPVVDRYLQNPAPSKLATCEYEVMSGANAVSGPSDSSVRVTLPWTPRPCNGNITITVGQNGNCPEKGNKTCLVFTRAHTNTGLIGNVTYQEYSISY